MDERPAVTAGIELRRARLAAGKSLVELSRVTHYSKGYLSRVETGQRPLTLELARRSDSALDSQGALVRLVNRRVEGEQARTASVAHHQGPRADSAAIGWPMFPLPGVPSATMHERQYLQSVAAGNHRIHETSIAEFSLIFGHLRRIGWRASPIVVLPLVMGFLGSLDLARKTAGAEMADQFSLMMSNCADFAGWMYQEIGDFESAAWWTDQSVVLGNQDIVAAYALVRKAEFAIYNDDLILSTRLAAQAREQAGAQSARVRVLAAQRGAQAHALLGNHDECMTLLNLAAELLETVDDENELGPVIGPSSVANLQPIITAWCLVDLGHAEDAAEILDREVTQIPAEALRSRARFGIRRALAHAGCGDVTVACDLAESLLPLTACIDSYTVSFDLRRLVQALRRWRSRAHVQALVVQLSSAAQVTRRTGAG